MGAALTATVREGAMTKGAAAQVRAALTAPAQAGAMTKGAATQVRAALTATAQAGAMVKGAAAQAGLALTVTGPGGGLAQVGACLGVGCGAAGVASELKAHSAKPPPVIKTLLLWRPAAF